MSKDLFKKLDDVSERSGDSRIVKLRTIFFGIASDSYLAKGRMTFSLSYRINR